MDQPLTHGGLVPKVGLCNKGMSLEGEVACHNDMLNASINPEGNLVGEEQLCSYR